MTVRTGCATRPSEKAIRALSIAGRRSSMRSTRRTAVSPRKGSARSRFTVELHSCLACGPIISQLRGRHPFLAQWRPMLKVKLLSTDATLPTVAHPGEDIGYDLYSCEDVTIPAYGAVGVHTGIAIEFVPRAGGLVKTRSG